MAFLLFIIRFKMFKYITNAIFKLKLSSVLAIYIENIVNDII